MADQYECENGIICYNNGRTQNVLYVIDEDNVINVFKWRGRHCQNALHRNRWYIFNEEYSWSLTLKPSQVHFTEGQSTCDMHFVPSKCSSGFEGLPRFRVTKTKYDHMWGEICFRMDNLTTFSRVCQLLTVVIFIHYKPRIAGEILDL